MQKCQAHMQKGMHKLKMHHHESIRLSGVRQPSRTVMHSDRIQGPDQQITQEARDEQKGAV